MALLLLAAQALVLRWSLRPLRRVTRDLSAIEAGRQERLEGQYPREIQRLTDNLNGLLKREHARQKRYRDALADLAHSLKTPLAVMRGALSGEAKQHTLSSTVEERVVHMDRIVEYQLQRAATAGRFAGLAAHTPVEPVVAKIVASLDKVYRDKQVATVVEVDSKTDFRGDEGQGVEDDGPGIDTAEARLIPERGVRADQAVPGHGIGLAIVHDIVNAYEGEIVIGKSLLGGAAVRIHIPNG